MQVLRAVDTGTRGALHVVAPYAAANESAAASQ